MLRIMDTKGLSSGIERISPTIHSAARASVILHGDDCQRAFSLRFDREGFELLRGMVASLDLLFERVDETWEKCRPFIKEELRRRWENSKVFSDRKSLVRRPLNLIRSAQLLQTCLDLTVDDIVEAAKKAGVVIDSRADLSCCVKVLIDDYDRGALGDPEVVLRASKKD